MIELDNYLILSFDKPLKKILFYKIRDFNFCLSKNNYRIKGLWGIENIFKKFHECEKNNYSVFGLTKFS